jgi:hypothetical protein
LRKAINYVRSVCPCVPLDGISRNLIFENFSKIYGNNSSCSKIWREQQAFYTKTYTQGGPKVGIQYIVYYIPTFGPPCTFMIISRSVLLRKRMFQAKFVEKIKTHILCSETFPENRAVYEVMWKKCLTAGQATDDNISRRTRFACRVTKATDTYSERYTYCFCTAIMITRTRFRVTLYVSRLSCVSCSKWNKLFLLLQFFFVSMNFVVLFRTRFAVILIYVCLCVSKGKSLSLFPNPCGHWGTRQQ